MAGLKYKGSDGEFHLLNNVLIKGIEVVQTSGTSTLAVMSQDAVTKELSGINETLDAHTGDTVIHVTQADKDRWDSDSIPSSAVTSMTGYLIAESGTPISTSDTLNEAIGKLEKMINDLKNYVSVIQSIDNRLQTVEGIIEDS